jgi:lysophospholipase
MPYFQENFITGILKSRRGGDIRYAISKTRGQAGAVVIVGGRTEFMRKYSEILYDLRNSGYTFLIFDHRGQGESSRLLPDPQKGHVERFDDYVEDLHLFLDTLVPQRQNINLLTHSMGGAVSILHERKYPGTVAGIILCSPMFSINTAPFPDFAARVLSKGLRRLGFGNRYVFGGGPYDPGNEFTANELTDSFARYELNRKLLAENPRLTLGSPTIAWLDEAFSAMRRIRLDARPLQIPMLLLVGEEDTVVGQKLQQEFCRVQSNCSLVVLAGGKHELLMEKDQVRDSVLLHIKDFLNWQRKRFGR